MIRKAVLSLCWLALFVGIPTTQADEMLFPAEHIVATSDLIVVGRFVQTGNEIRKNVEFEAGNITIERVLHGVAEAGKVIDLSWQNPVGRVCPRTDHSHLEGRKVLWLLEAGDEGNESFKAAGSQRAIALDDPNALSYPRAFYQKALEQYPENAKLNLVVELFEEISDDFKEASTEILEGVESQSSG